MCARASWQHVAVAVASAQHTNAGDPLRCPDQVVYRESDSVPGCFLESKGDMSREPDCWDTLVRKTALKHPPTLLAELVLLFNYDIGMFMPCREADSVPDDFPESEDDESGEPDPLGLLTWPLDSKARGVAGRGAALVGMGTTAAAAGMNGSSVVCCADTRVAPTGATVIFHCMKLIAASKLWMPVDFLWSAAGLLLTRQLQLLTVFYAGPLMSGDVMLAYHCRCQGAPECWFSGV